jgi:hypothetical protein
MVTETTRRRRKQDVYRYSKGIKKRVIYNISNIVILF